MLDENEIDMEFGRFIYDLRNDMNLTVASVALRTRINPIRIRQLERGDVLVGVKATECLALADCFGIESEVLLNKARGGDC